MQQKKSTRTLYARIRRSETSMQAMTSLTIEEFQSLAREFAIEWSAFHEHYTLEGKPRQRRATEKKSDILPTVEDKLLFIMVYLKTYPIQEALAAMFSMQQSHANVWIHLLSEHLIKTLRRLGHLPESNGQSLEWLLEGCERVYLDGTERAVQRSGDDETQRQDFSGKKKTTLKKTSFFVMPRSAFCI